MPKSQRSDSAEALKTNSHLSREAFAAAVKCQDAEDFPSLLEGVRPGFDAIGFEYFSVIEAIADEEGEGLRPLIGRAHEAWQSHYRQNRLHVADFRFRRARLSARPFFCTEVLREDRNVTEVERGFWNAAADFGIREGYVYPHRTAGGRVFAAVLVGRGRVIDASLRVASQMLSYEFISAALRLEARLGGGRPAKPVLSRRQTECLQLLAAGKNTVSIAHELGLSSRTVEHYLADASAKLRVRSRAQAVATAVGLNLIDQP